VPARLKTRPVRVGPPFLALLSKLPHRQGRTPRGTTERATCGMSGYSWRRTAARARVRNEGA
jgi:hypothetical protein